MPKWMLAGMYRLGPISRWLRKGLNRNLPSGLQITSIAAGPLRGMKMELNLQSEKDYWLGSYELELVGALKQATKGKHVAYDVGANIGYISLMLAQLLGDEGQVYSFEALPGNQERWKGNITLNQLDERVHLQAVAVSKTSGKARFMVHASGGMGKLSSAKGRDEDYAEEIEVDSLALDDAVYRQKSPAPELIKIDIEGGEGAALRGMTRLLKEKRPTLFIELHGYEAAREVFEQLTNHNYSMRELKAGSRFVKDVEQLNWKSYVVAEPQS